MLQRVKLKHLFDRSITFTLGVGIAQIYAAAFPDAKLEVLTVLASGNSAAAEYRATGTHQGDLFGILPSGKSINLQIANLIELRDGLIYREREYIDMTQCSLKLAPAKV